MYVYYKNKTNNYYHPNKYIREFLIKVIRIITIGYLQTRV